MCSAVAPSILVLEDEFLIALDVEHILREAGFADLIIVTSCHDAMIWLLDNSPSIGILDLNLKDGQSDEVARTLSERGIPFVICSGVTQSELPPAFSQGTFLGKPCCPDLLIAAVQQAFSVSPLDDVVGKSGQSPKRRGPSPRGIFDQSKAFATASEDARIKAHRIKTELLRLLRRERDMP